MRFFDEFEQHRHMETVFANVFSLTVTNNYKPILQTSFRKFCQHYEWKLMNFNTKKYCFMKNYPSFYSQLIKFCQWKSSPEFFSN